MRILWFGLGSFGLPIALRCLRQGAEVSTLTGGRGREGARALTRAGGHVDVNTADMDVLALCLPSPAEVEEVLSRLDRLPPYVLDLTSGDPASSRRFARLVGERGGVYVDAPVSGSPERAADGSLTVFAGTHAGRHSTVDDLLETIGGHVAYLGGAGDGQAAKLTNQIIHLCNMVAIGEGLTFAQAHGLDLAEVVRALKTASADSAMLRRFGDSVAARDFAPHFALQLALKDLRNAHEAACEAGLELAVSMEVLDRYEHAMATGHANKNFSVVADPGAPLAGPNTTRARECTTGPDPAS